MDLYLLAELKTISLKVTTVDMQKPPPDFRYAISSRISPDIIIDLKRDLYLLKKTFWQLNFNEPVTGTLSVEHKVHPGREYNP